MSSASFTDIGQTPVVSFLPGSGTYTAAQTVSLSDTDTAASIYYTTDGSTPTASSKPYSRPIAVASSTTIKAVAIDPVLASSNVARADYVIQPGGSSIDFGSGFSSVAGLTLNGSAVNTDDSRLQLTTAGTNQAGSVFWNQPIGIQTFTTDFLFQLSSAQGDGFTFTIQNVGPSALGPSGSGLGYQKIAKSIAIKFDLYSNAGEGTDSTGVYTNGAAPTVPAVDMSASGVVLRSGDSIQAHITYDGTTLSMTLLDLVTNKTFVLTKAVNIPQIVGGNTAYVGFTGSTGGLTASQKILYWTYATQAPSSGTAAPSFSPAGGNYSTAPSVTLSDSTPGAVIYFTTNGTAPTTSSFVYTSPIVPGMGTTTIEAMAVASGSTPSAVVAATYVVTQAVTATPTFSPAGGTYTASQNVTLSDSTAGAVIYYTTNGTTPTTSSTVYSTAINVAASETIRAIAVAPGAQPSSVASAAYVIQPGGSSIINFGSGFPNAAGLTLNGSAVNTAKLLQLTTTSGTYQAGSVFWNQPIGIQTFTTDFSFQLSSAQGDGFTFAIQNVSANALGASGAGLGYQKIVKSVAVKFDLYSNAGEGADSTGVYSNGAAPTVPAVDMTASGVQLKSGDVMLAHVTYDGTTLSMNLLDQTTNKSLRIDEGHQHSPGRGWKHGLCRLHGEHGRARCDPENSDLDIHYAGVDPNHFGAGVFATRGQLHDAAECDVDGQHGRRGDLLHDGRNGTDDLIFGLQRRHPGGHRDDDDQGYGGGERIVAERGGDGDIRDWTECDGDADLQTGGRHVHGGTKRNSLRQHCGCRDLLHDRRDDANNFVSAIFSADSRDRIGDCQSSCRGSGCAGQLRCKRRLCDPNREPDD